MSELPAITSPSVLDAIIKDPKVRRVFIAAAAMAGKGLHAAGRKALIELVSSFSAYEDYLLQTYKRVSTIKTFAAPTTPVPLLDQFVDTYLVTGSGDQFDQFDLVNKITSGTRIVISALAGFGKSVLMRYLALSLYENPSGKIPIFIDLRDLNRAQSPDISSYIHSNYKQSSNIDKKVFERGLQKGLFCIFLDGFDEINYDQRPKIQSNILQLSNDYPNIALVVSGRPDPIFQSWREFSTLSITPMNLEQVKLLIENIDYDDGLKSRFIQKLDGGLYDRHSSFLSTPLLATLMMLTYEQNANIPEKMHLFYQRAFETLFDKHDTFKEQYERKRKSNLRIDQFSRLFSVFCMNTYLSESFEFSNIGILESINDAISYCGYNVLAEEILFDLTESVCLIQREGLFYSFVHRSFQEYFTAVFLCNCPDGLRDEFLSSFVFRPWDSVLVMLFDMSTDRLEAAWVSPRTKEYLDFVEKEGQAVVSLRSVLARWEGIELQIKDGEAIFHRLIPGRFNNVIYILSQFYADRFEKSLEYLSIELVDELGRSISSLWNSRYRDYRDYIVDGDTVRDGAIKSYNFASGPAPLMKSDMPNQELEVYDIVRNISSSIDDSLLIRQRFLGKIKESRG